MKKIQNSELVTNDDGCVYHLNLLPEHLADTIILVGDPGRVSIFSQCFDSIEVKRANREIITHTGYVGNTRITVMSTGMGTDNIDIVMTELDVLANFDLKTKTLNDTHKSLNIIRIGTCGALQADIPINTVILTHYVIGLDGILYFYDCPDGVFENDLKHAFVNHVNWSTQLPNIYCVKVNEKLEKLFYDNNIVKGITLSAPGFYGPQGRSIHLPVKYPKINQLVETFSYNGYRVLNYEMESSAMYGLGRALEHNTLSMCVVVANRIRGEFNSDAHNLFTKYSEQILSRLENI